MSATHPVLRPCAMGLLTIVSLLPVGLFAQATWNKHGNPVLSPGTPGAWDDQIVYPGTVVKQGDAYKMWYTGYDGTYLRIGYATSSDGIVWSKHAAPVLDLGASGAWDDYWVGVPIVHVSDTLYRMWYIGDEGNSQQRTGYATSTDGIHWTKYAQNPVIDHGSAGSWDDFAVCAGPVTYDTVFKMIYQGFESGTTGTAGYAWSIDGIQWTKATAPVLDLGSWDTPRLQPNGMVYVGHSSSYACYYGGGGFFTWRVGLATAMDPSGPWTKQGIVLDVSPGRWDSRFVGFPCVLYDSTSRQWKMWYMGGTSEWSGSVGYATTPIRVPAHFGSIQQAIDAASDGDMVVASEGTYYESIRFRGKRITVGSEFILDGDTAHISRTIIDGSHATAPDSGSVVYFVDGEDTTSILSGFTIQGGDRDEVPHSFFMAKYVGTGRWRDLLRQFRTPRRKQHHYAEQDQRDCCRRRRNCRLRY